MFLEFIGIRDAFSKLTNDVYNAHWRKMVDWWNDHDQGKRSWTNISTSSLTNTGQFLAADGSTSVPSYSFTSDTDTGLYLVTATIGVVIGGVVVGQFTGSNGFAFTGTKTNDNASTGSVGQYASSVVGPVTFPATTVFGDATSISLTAGDWDVTLVGYIGPQTLVTGAALGISVTSGTSTTGLVSGDNFASELVPPTAALATNVCVANWRRSLSSTTTIYAKFQATYTGTAPVFYGRLSARRPR